MEKQPFYIMQSGEIRRKNNTVFFENESTQKVLPIEKISTIYACGAVSINSALLNFLGKENISIHFFDYYGHYTGSFVPREYLLSGHVLVSQALYHADTKLRLEIAKEIIEGAVSNILSNFRNFSYHKNVNEEEEEIKLLQAKISETESIEALMALEGNIRNYYYSAMDKALENTYPDFMIGERTRQPPLNKMNALMSFGNTLAYTVTLDEIYHTQLNPTIGYLHSLQDRRYTLSLDISEIFKPILVDRLNWRLIQNREITAESFSKKEPGVYLKDKERGKYLRKWEELLNQTVLHRKLRRHVSYRHLIRLECYKLVKHVIGEENYKSFKIWW
jgi:CRISPR-associated protein Cas1